MDKAIYFPITLSAYYDETTRAIKKKCSQPMGWQNIEESQPCTDCRGLQTGKRSNITVVDFDDKTTFESTLAQIPELQKVKRVMTRKGAHLYFQYDERLNNSTDCFQIPLVDIRNDGGFIIAPPSHYSFDGTEYTYEDMGGEVLPIPDALFQLIKPNGLKHQYRVVDGDEKENLPPVAPSELADLVQLLSAKRATSYSDWSKVGFGINNIMGRDGFDLFIEFSKKCIEKYSYRDCRDWYSRLSSKKQGGITIRSFHFWAKQDSPAEYKEKFGKPLTWEILGHLNHQEMAHCYASLVNQDYVYSGGCWYKYNTVNIMERLTKDNPPGLLMDISRVLQTEVRSMLSNHPQNDAYASHCKLVSKVFPALGTASFIEGVMKFLKSIYQNDKLYELIDANMNLVAFEDGIVFDYDLKELRTIEREDYIMFHCHYSINGTKYNQTIYEELTTLFESIYGTEEKMSYALDTIAMSLFRNNFEKFYVHTGRGGNGKGVVFQLCEQAFGDYYYQAPNEFLTTTYRADAPNSVLANAKGRRLLATCEPSTEDSQTGKAIKINTDLVKTLSGGDTINCRDLYESAKKSFKPTFTPFLQANAIPELTKVDDGIRRRLEKLDYPYQFKTADRYDPTDPKQRLADINLKTKLSRPEYITQFMMMILERAVKFESFKVPQDVKEKSATFLNQNDTVMSWLTDFMIKDEVSKDERISPAQAYAMFLTDMSITKKDVSDKKFYQSMEMNGWEVKKIGKQFYAMLKRKPEEADEE